MQKLVNSIPTKRDDIFSWDLKWNMVDHTLMEKRIAPWINKKIVEYIGETDPDITDFLCNKVCVRVFECVRVCVSLSVMLAFSLYRVKLAEHVTADDLLRDFAVVSDARAYTCLLTKRGHSLSFVLTLSPGHGR